MMATILVKWQKKRKVKKIDIAKEIPMNDYALHKGDEFLDLGTIKYLSKKYHIEEKTLRYYGMPTGIKRAGKNGYIVIKIEESTNE